MFYWKTLKAVILKTIGLIGIIVFYVLIINLTSKVLHLYYPYYRNIDVKLIIKTYKTIIPINTIVFRITAFSVFQ